MEAPDKGDESTLPLLTPKTAGGSQRVIKQIMVIDPNKLRMAGLDVKMAEALKKSKKKSQPKSKESKLAAAKSILNKKLKEALSKKVSPNATLPPTPSKSVLSIEEAAKKLSSSQKNRAQVKTKPKISVASLKSLMPPPSFPVSSLISPNQTVEIKVLKSEKTKQSIEVKILDSETPQKIDTFPKASLKTQSTPKTVKTKTFTPEIEFEARKNSSLSEDQDEPVISTQSSGETSQTVIVHVEDKKKTRKGSLKEKNTSGSVQSKSFSNAIEPSKNKSRKIVHWESPPNANKLNEKTNPNANQGEPLVVEAETLIEMVSLMPIETESLPKASESSLKIINSIPVRRESLPKVIESKVLSPAEKIDLSILTKKTPTALTVPKKRYKLDQNWVTSESNRAESVYLNLSPVSKPSPPKAVEQESAVDFINNLSVFFAESQKNKSQTKNVSEILTKECGEDATSFLVSLFQNKQDTSPKTQTTPIEKNEGSKTAPPIKTHCSTNDVQKDQKISRRDTSSETSSITTNTQVSDLEINNLPDKENETNKDLQVVESLHETTIDNSQSSATLHSEEKSIHDSKSMISNSEKDPKPIELKESIEPFSDLTKTNSNASLLSPEADKGISDVSVSLVPEYSFVNESLQESESKSSTPLVSSRRKASKPIPVLIPKLRKSRKPTTIAQKPPEDIIPEKCTEKPEEESPTQPVQNKEELKDSILSESTPFETEVQKKELSNKCTKSAKQKIERKRRDTNKEELIASSIPSSSRVSAQILDELPTTSKTERPQRQRKISLKLSSEFQGVVDRTVEQMIKKNRESTTSTERPQRQRKVSFKLLESSESLPTIAKQPFQALANSGVQEIRGKIELSSTTERPQRQRRITFKLLESSESLSTMKSLVQVKNRSVEKEVNEKVELKIAKEKPQCTQKNTEKTNLDSLIAIEMGNEAIKDPIAQLVAFHETVEKFELACGSVNSKNTETATNNLEGECSSLTEYPFHDAICSEMSTENIQTNQPTEGKENISGDQTSSKILRKRKDSLKSRTFAGEEISIVSGDTFRIPDETPKNIKNASSVKQTRKRKETPTIHQSENEDLAENFDLTPKLIDTQSHARNLVSEIVKNEEKFSSESKEIVNNSTVEENLNVEVCFSAPPQSTNTETPTNTNVKKRRGRPPKVKKQIRKLRVVEKAAEVAQKTTRNSSIEPITTVISKNDNLGGSWETIPSTDEHHSQEIAQVELVENVGEGCLLTTKTSFIPPNSNIGGLWETLPSVDEHLSQEVAILDKSGSKIAKKTTEKSYSPKSKGGDGTPDNEDNIAEEFTVNAEDCETKLSEEENETPKLTKSKTLSIESESEVAKEYEIHKRDCPSKVSNISEKLVFETTKKPIELHKIPHQAQNQEEKPSTSKLMKMFDKASECKEGTNMVEAIHDIKATKNTPDKHEFPQGTTEFIKTLTTASTQTIKISKSFSDVDKISDKIPIEASKVQSYIDKRQSLSRDDFSNYNEMIKAAIDIGTLDRELRTVESQSCGKQLTSKDGLFDEVKPLAKENESKYNRDFQKDEQEVIPETSEPNSFDPFKTSKIKPSDSLEPCQVICQVSEGQSTSRVELCDHPELPETSRATETGQESNKNLLVKQSTSSGDLFDRSIDNETSNAFFSAAQTDESHISEKQSMSKDDLFEELKCPNSESKINESKPSTDLPKTKDPAKIVPHFEDLMFDLDHIESPSFSPICESSRISNNSDGFEEFDEDFTSAIIETVTEAENYAEQTLEKSLNSSVFTEESQNNSKSTQEPKVSKLVDQNTDNLEKSPSKSSENPKSLESAKSDSVKESPALQTSFFVTMDPICEKDKPSSSFDLPKKTSDNYKIIEGKISSSNSSILNKKCTDDTKQIEQPTPDDVSSAVNSPILVKSSDKGKESPLLMSTVLEKKSPDNSKQLDKQKSDIAAPNSALSTSDLIQNSPNYPKSTEGPTSDKIKQSSALYSAVVTKSESKKNNAKNPFKMLKPKKHQEQSGIKSHIEFLGFDDKEIEEGQQSTSLRLSQSEDAECFNIDSPSTSNIKPKHNIKESHSISGKKQKQDKEKWEKNSAKSLKNWLSNPIKTSNDDVCDIKEDTKEQSSSVPPKKRRSKVQNLIDPIPLKKVVEVNDANTTIKSVDLSLIEESSNSSAKKEKPKRGRKPKQKNVEKIEDNLPEDISSSKEDINSSSKSFSKSRKSLLVDAESSIDKKPKRGRKLKVTNYEEFKTPRSEKKSKVADQSISVNVKKEPSEKILTPMKGKANKRKRSVSEKNAPATTEPPTKVAHLDRDLNSSDSFRKPGRPKKSTVNDSSKVANVPVVQNSPIQRKYKDDYEFNPRLLLIRNKEELKSNEPLIDPHLQTEPKGPDDVQCALCMGYASKKKWIQHVSTHYGIGWIVGRPPPLNINSRGSILSYLLEFYRVSKVKGLSCRLCKSLRRSALGLLMHLEQCCLTEKEINDTRVVCEYCKRNYTKSSYLVHKRTCPEYLKQILKEAKAETLEVPEGPTPDDVLSNTGRLKRKAVIMAETKLKKLDETPDFVPDDLIKHIPTKNIRSIESIKENWHMEINSFGKGFCASKTCRFTAIAIDDLIDHYQEKVCPYYEKAGYFCVRCKFYNQNIEAVRSHVIDRHSPKPPRGKGDIDAEIDSSESSDSISSEEDDVESESGSVDGNGERKPKRKKKPKLKARRRTFHCKNPPTKDYRKLLPERCSNVEDVVAKFYDEFIETNYSLDPLFTFAKTNVTYIEASESYFPKSADSMKFICNGFKGFVKILGESKVQPDQWKQLERLHGMTENCEYTIYMGGPVKNIAWVPLDPHPPSNTQYLAVTVRKGLDKFTRFLNQKRSRSLIFILKFDISMLSEIKAEILYAIAIDEGPIHAIEFLPSGGYSPKMNRLGMLAVGTIETEIKIYSLPLKVEKRDCDFFPIVRLEASIELRLELLDNPSDKTDIYSSQCTCLVWSQTAGHNIIVGSFLNGFVGIWDISDDAGYLNQFDENESRKFTPISYFWTSEDRLMNLVLHYDMNGPRWLAASNSTRKMMLYDLRDITQPMLLRVEVTINIINSIEWPIAWENVMFGLGDAMPSNGCFISAFSPMALMFTTRRFEKFCSGVTDIHFNIWRNCFAAGADNGDVQVTPLREAVLDVSQRLKTDEKTISTLDIVSLNGENISQNRIQIPSEGMRVFDKDHKDEYGIVFGSLRKIKGCNKPDYYNTHRVPPLNLQRLMRVSKIRFNQNKNACDVLAIGYDNGLLRISTHDWIKKG